MPTYPCITKPAAHLVQSPERLLGSEGDHVTKPRTQITQETVSSQIKPNICIEHLSSTE